MSAKSNIAKLPEWCYTIDNITGKINIIKAGESGFYRSHDQGPDPDNKEATRAYAEAENALRGISKGQAEAMEMGSMFGWEVPAADLDTYNEDGSAKKEVETA